MNLKSVKVFLHFLIFLTICQYIQSQYHEYKYSLKNILSANINADQNFVGDSPYAGGQYAGLGDFPYMVVVHQLLDGWIKICGGTIISARWVLTAAHCIEQEYPLRFLVVFGIVDKFGIRDSYQGPGVSMIATQAFIHPDYKQFQNADIALLYMPQDIPFSKTIQPINLAYQDPENFEGKNAFVVGWGKVHTNSKDSRRLQYAELPIIKNTICRHFWPVNEKQVCTAPGLRDACQGDSGGPLVVVKNGMHFQIGIVSFGSKYCPGRNFPGVFTRVSSFINWIHEVMMRKSYDFRDEADYMIFS